MTLRVEGQFRACLREGSGRHGGGDLYGGTCRKPYPRPARGVPERGIMRPKRRLGPGGIAHKLRRCIADRK